MTVSYQKKLGTAKPWILFKLLLRWKGSIYKVVWLDLVVFTVLFMILKAIYKLALDDDQKRIFEVLCRYCDKNSNLIPVSFVLGFYVSIVMTRWWNQYLSIPWPSSTAVKVSAAISGQDDYGRLIRRTIIRYLNLSHILTFRKVSIMVMKRFPTLQHIVDSGMMNESERNILEKMTEELKTVPQWLPAVWAVAITKKAYMSGKIQSAVTMQAIIDSIDSFRGSCGLILAYDWISVPLMYTQVVTWAVYTFFLACVMGRQFVDSNKDREDDIDLYLPVFTFLQFFFYIGWLKVAQTLMNPFGEDDDDFEMNYIIDTNIKTSFRIVDELHEDHPEIVKDQFWDETVPADLPYTIASEKFKRDGPPPGSAEEVEIPAEDLDYASLMEVESDYESIPGSSIMPKKSPGLKSRKGSFMGSLLSTYEDRFKNSPDIRRKKKNSSIRSNGRKRTVSENSKILQLEDNPAENNNPVPKEEDQPQKDETPKQVVEAKTYEIVKKLSVVQEHNEDLLEESTQTEMPQSVDNACVHCGSYPTTVGVDESKCCSKDKQAEEEEDEGIYSTIKPDVPQNPINPTTKDQSN